MQQHYHGKVKNARKLQGVIFNTICVVVLVAVISIIIVTIILLLLIIILLLLLLRIITIIISIVIIIIIISSSSSSIIIIIIIIIVTITTITVRGEEGGISPAQLPREQASKHSPQRLGKKTRSPPFAALPRHNP